MTPYKGFKLGLKLGLEFWLPLPLIGLAFWMGGGFVMDGILSRAKPTTYVKNNTELPQKRKTVILSITADIDTHQGVSIVKVRTASRSLKELVFEFPVTEASEVEVAISRELGLEIEDIRKLMRYQIRNNNVIE
ncbi:MAG: hypothetical protein SAK29_06810 [Scytonema sp. PMC 1069.18]|nr:hypothetical protein [Scytonema sp. PMC 1069.18]MEC4881424.1 hypothetical protein [Scytonema sp. PMC 1070.18]